MVDDIQGLLKSCVRGAALTAERVFKLSGVFVMSSSVWIRAASVQEVDEAGGLLARMVNGVAITLYGVESTYYATSDQCTHGQARLSDGYLDGFLIECPLHQGLFDIRNGEVRGAPCTIPLPVFAVRREGDDLLVDLSSDGSRS
jgi:naphthalene 1,2-dioxygenase ferredoxin component